MTLARFTPSLLDGDVLERLFVHREGLLEDALARIRASAGTDERRHRLFVGPRGAGKTHLLSLVHYRAARLRDDGLRIHLSWLLEDPWEIETYEDLLEQILEQADSAPPRTELTAEAEIRRWAASAPTVVLVENLDQILARIGRDGQRRLRALLENDRPLLIIATSTRLSDERLSQIEPFYGFFDTTQLEPFTVDQAADMLAAIAEVSSKPALASLLRSTTGRARPATIEHLAGGQPRVWALLGTGLSSTGIDDMVDMLLSRFDDLTPYYQEQLARLSPNEAKVVRRLADADRPLTVNALATASRIDPKSAAKTVSDLRRKGWVRQYRSILTEKVDARLRYYELAEPLARIAFQVKAARGKPISLVLDFLGTWYDTEQLRSEASSTAGAAYLHGAVTARPGTAALLQALVGSLGEVAAPAPRPALVDFVTVLDDGVDAWERGDASALLRQPSMVSRLVAQKLDELSAPYFRVELARVAILHGGAVHWRTRIDELATRPDQLVRAEALLLAAVIDLGGTPSSAVHATLAALAAAVSQLEPGQADRLIAGSGMLIRTLEFGQRLSVRTALDANLAFGWAWQAVQRQRVAALLASEREDDAVTAARVLARAAESNEGEDSADHLGALDLLGMAEACTDRFDSAARTFRELAVRKARVHGADARTTLHTRWVLTLVLRSLGDEGLVAAVQALAADCDAALGASDTLTRTVRAELDTLSV